MIFRGMTRRVCNGIAAATVTTDDDEINIVFDDDYDPTAPDPTRTQVIDAKILRELIGKTLPVLGKKPSAGDSK